MDATPPMAYSLHNMFCVLPNSIGTVSRYWRIGMRNCFAAKEFDSLSNS